MVQIFYKIIHIQQGQVQKNTPITKQNKYKLTRC